MELVQQITRNRLLSFLLGTIVVQSTMLLVALSYHYRSAGPTKQSVVMDVGQASETTPVAASVLNQDTPSVAEAALEASEQGDQVTNQTFSFIVAKGDTLSSLWKKAGASHLGSLKAAKALEGAKIGPLRLGETVELSVVDSEVVELRRKLNKSKTLVLQGNSVDGYQSNIVEQGHLEQERVVVGTIKSSFALATAKRAVPYDIIDEFVDLFSSRVEFRRDFQPGDEFTLVYSEQRLPNGELVSTGPITSASLRLSGQMLAIVRYAGSDGKATYFDENGKPIGNYFLRYPLQFSRISSVFTDSRFHPVLGVRRPHMGVDFAAPTGTPVRAVADGRIIVAGYRGASGNMIKIEHGSRYATAYLHLSKIAPGVRNGAIVTKGEIIGQVGMTGLASGPHLHFALYDRGTYVDPLKASLPVLELNKKDMITPSYLQAAIQNLRRYHTIAQLASVFGLEPGLPPA